MIASDTLSASTLVSRTRTQLPSVAAAAPTDTATSWWSTLTSWRIGSQIPVIVASAAESSVAVAQ